MNKKQWKNELVKEDFHLILHPQYAPRHPEATAPAGLNKLHHTLWYTSALFAVIEIFMLLIPLGLAPTMNTVVPLSYIITNVFALCLFFGEFVFTLCFTAERLSKHYEAAFALVQVSLFSLMLFIFNLTSGISDLAGFPLTMHWIIAITVMVISGIIVYLRTIHQIKKGAYREDGGGFWGKRIYHFGGKHLLPAIALLSIIGAGAAGGMAQFFTRAFLKDYPDAWLPLLIALIIMASVLFSSLLAYSVALFNTMYRVCGLKIRNWSELTIEPYSVKENI